MIDEFAKEYLHDEIRWARASILSKLDGLSEYDVRRPLTSTGTNLLGLIKHLTNTEVTYFGDIFDRPFPEALSWRADGAEEGADMWVTEDETRAEIIERYRRSWEHSAETIEALAVDTSVHVRWWPSPDAKLFNIMVHVITETNRHAGHADILREQLDGVTGESSEPSSPGGPGGPGEALWESRCARIEKAARAFDR